MKIVIAGGTGFLGRAARRHAGSPDGHDVVVLLARHRRCDRHAQARVCRGSPDGSVGPWASELDGADAVVNLAGRIDRGPALDAPQKQRILDSRVLATRSLVAAISRSAPARRLRQRIGGRLLRSAGRRDRARRTRRPARISSPSVCVRVGSRSRARGRVRARASCCIRTGLVLERDGGALPQMLPPFWFGAGGPVGSGGSTGRGFTVDDWIGLVRWAIATPSPPAPLNATAPTPVTNAEFARALGRALAPPGVHAGAGVRAEAALGEMADALLLSGQRAVPAKAERARLHVPLQNARPGAKRHFQELPPGSERLRRRGSAPPAARSVDDRP